MRLKYLITVLFLVFCRPVRVRAQAMPSTVRTDRHIPKGAKSYSLFLVCNSRWLGRGKRADLSSLHDSFQDFGNTIGDENDAVWFSKKNQNGPDGLDVRRSISYCQKWDLKPSESPYLVITTSYPESESGGLPPGSAVFSLGSLSMGQIEDLLSKLSDDLLKYDAVKRPPPPVAPSSNEKKVGDEESPTWTRMLYAVQRSFGSFGCGWSFELNSGPVKTKWEPCKK